MFVSTRVAEIQSATNVTDWHYVNTKENPADILSRGASVKELTACSMWWSGPKFLQQDFSAKLIDKIDLQSKAEAAALDEYNKEHQTAEVHTLLFADEPLICKYESLEKVLRVTAYALRFIKLCRDAAAVTRQQAIVSLVQTRAARRAERLQLVNNEAAIDNTATADNVELPSEASAETENITDTSASSVEPMEAEPAIESIPVAFEDVGTSGIAIPTPAERAGALTFWIRDAQITEYGTEYAALQQKEPIARNSKLAEMTPFMDSEGIIRARGRLSASSLSYDQKHPIIISASALLTKRLIKLAHLQTLHGGTQLTIHKLRERYWIPRLRTAVRSIIRHCLICCRQRAATEEQLMADLPSHRVNQARPFSNCGVDFAGPFRVKAWDGRVAPVCSKAYVAVFVCFVVKAVHLELVSDLTTSAFLDALDRMMARKGQVNRMSSDNGRTLVGADNELRQRLQDWMSNCEELREAIAAKNIEWHFITPLSPHHGGLWESAVKSMKYHLVRSIDNSVYTYEQLSTLLARIEACMNSRPLTPLTDDPSDLTALTPAHFLGISPAMALLSESTLATGDISNNIASLTQEIWKRWHNEYLTLLNRRDKWRNQQANLQTGDLVILKEDHTPPATWPLARIIDVHPGADGLVRSVTVRTGSRTYKRPIVKCCKVPTSEPEATC